MRLIKVILIISTMIMLATAAWPKNESFLTGRVYFLGYSTMGGKTCSGFMVADNGTYYCLTASDALTNLKTQVSGNPVTRVSVKGEVTQNGDVRYLDMDDFTVISSTPSSLGSIPGQPEVQPSAPPTSVPPMSPRGY